VSFLITPAAPDSPPASSLIAALDDHLGRFYPQTSRHGYSVAKLLADNVVFFLILDTDRAAPPASPLPHPAVGCGGLLPVPRNHPQHRPPEEPYAEIKRMFVIPEMRGRNLGHLMLTHLAAHARSQGFCLLRLETGIHQSAAIRLYQRFGFTPIPPFGPYIEDPLNLCMKMRI